MRLLSVEESLSEGRETLYNVLRRDEEPLARLVRMEGSWQECGANPRLTRTFSIVIMVTLPRYQISS